MPETEDRDKSDNDDLEFREDGGHLGELLPNEPDDEEQSDEPLYDEDWASDYRWPLDHLLAEIRGQHSEALSLIGSSTQRSGIIMAFSSVLFIELFRLPYPEWPWFVAFIFLALSVLTGLVSVFLGRNIPLGADVNNIVNAYNDEESVGFVVMIIDEKWKALEIAKRSSDRIAACVLIQIVMLTLSILALVYLEVVSIGLV